MSHKVAFIGLGVMGFPMAGYISKAGHDVIVYNRTSAKADKWVGTYKEKQHQHLLKLQKMQTSFLHVLEMIMI